MNKVGVELYVLVINNIFILGILGAAASTHKLILLFIVGYIYHNYIQ